MQELLRTKITIPPLRAERLPREHLLARLDLGAHRKVTLVVAPAGSGKTSLVSHWVQARSQPVSWLSLDEGDNDPIRFWSYLYAALARLYPLDELTPPDATQSVTAALTALINTMLASDRPGLLVLDDYQLIRDEAIHEGLAFFLEHLPPAFHLLLLTRQTPPLPLDKLRASGELEELTNAELRFTHEEAAAYLRQVVGQPLEPQALKELVARTEGWAVCLHLVALVLRRHTEPVEVLRLLQGSRNGMFDYMLNEVLGQLPGPQRQFLLHVAVLEQFSAQACAYVLDVADAEGLISELQQSLMLVVALDNEGHWFRLHHLLRELLQSLLREADAVAWQRLNSRAAIWFSGLDPAIAVPYAIRAADWPLAVELIYQAAPPLLFVHGEIATVLAWQQQLPPAVLEQHPLLLLLFARARLFLGQVGDVSKILAAVEERAQQVPLSAIAQGVLLALQARLTYEKRSLLLAEAQALLPAEAVFFRNDVLSSQATAFFYERNYAQAIAVSRQAMIAAWPLGDSSTFWFAVCMQMLALQDSGRLREALAVYSEATHLAEQQTLRRLHGSTFAGYALFQRGATLYDQGQHRQALNDLTAAIARLAAVGATRFVLGSCLQAAFVYTMLGDEAGASEMIRQARSWRDSSDEADFQLMHDVAMLNMALIRGDYREIVRWSRRDEQANDVPIGFDEFHQSLLAWANVLLGKADEALRIVEPLIETVRARGRVVLLLEVLTVAALAHAARNDLPAAYRQVYTALELALGERIVRPFLEKGQAMERLLASMHETVALNKAQTLFVSDLRQLFATVAPYPALLALPPAPPPAPQPGEASMAVALTPRERSVLQLIMAGSSNRQVADTLVISEETVKTYLKQIYRKLEVSTRTQAVSQARRLGLFEGEH
jgi:LuxR family transcriptional regulator, maltose regulon positive regulatory protein